MISFNLFIIIITLFSLFTTVFFFLILYDRRKNLNKTERTRDKTFSIIIPAYNEEENIEKCIESVKSQNYPDENLNITVVDDGSTDRTREICKEYERRREIDLIKKEHEGKVPSVNQALKETESDLFCVLDADTYFKDKDILERIGAYFEEKDVAACLTTLQIKKPKNWVEKIQLIEYYLSAFMRKILTFLNGLYTTHGASFYRTSAVKEAGYFDETNLVEDMEMTLRLIDRGHNIKADLNTVSNTIPPENFKDLLEQRLRWYTGFLENVRDYKHMMFNRKFIGIGMVSFPLSLTWTSILIIGFLWFAFNFITGNILRFGMLAATNWDILFYIQTLLGPLRIGISDVIMVIGFSLCIATAYLGYKLVKGTEKSGFSLSYIYYFFLFSLVQGIFWLASLLNFIVPREKKPWTGKT